MPVNPNPAPSAGSAPRRLPSPNLQRQQEEEGRVQDHPSANFVLAHPRDEWTLTEDGEIRPVIVQLSKSPGVQGVDRRGGFAHAEAYYRSQGFTLIPHDIVPGDYVAAYKNARGQAVHRSIFTEPVDGPNGTVWVHDGESWAKFLALLKLRGIVTTPRPHIVRSMLESVRQQYDQLRPPAIDDASRRDAYDRRVAMLRRQIATLEAALVESTKEHGTPEQRTGSGVGSMLDAALADAAAGKPPAPARGKGRGKSAPQVALPALPDDLQDEAVEG